MSSERNKVIRRPQFSIRTLFYLVSACALLLLAWRMRPSHIVRVEIAQNGSVLIQGDEVPITAISGRLNYERFLRTMWLMDAELMVSAHRNVSHNDVRTAIDSAQQAGFQRLGVQVYSD